MRYNAELANDFGNLLHRSLSMNERWLGGKIPALGDETEEDHALRECMEKSHADFSKRTFKNEIFQGFSLFGHLFEEETSTSTMNNHGDW